MVHHVPCWKQESSANQSEKLSKQKKREKETKAPFFLKKMVEFYMIFMRIELLSIETL